MTYFVVIIICMRYTIIDTSVKPTACGDTGISIPVSHVPVYYVPYSTTIDVFFFLTIL